MQSCKLLYKRVLFVVCPRYLPPASDTRTHTYTHSLSHTNRMSPALLDCFSDDMHFRFSCLSIIILLFALCSFPPIYFTDSPNASATCKIWLHKSTLHLHGPTKKCAAQLLHCALESGPCAWAVYQPQPLLQFLLWPLSPPPPPLLLLLLLLQLAALRRVASAP